MRHPIRPYIIKAWLICSKISARTGTHGCRLPMQGSNGTESYNDPHVRKPPKHGHAGGLRRSQSSQDRGQQSEAQGSSSATAKLATPHLHTEDKLPVLHWQECGCIDKVAVSGDRPTLCCAQRPGREQRSHTSIPMCRLPPPPAAGSHGCVSLRARPAPRRGARAQRCSPPRACTPAAR